MIKINCPFIVNIKFVFQDEYKLYIITDFMQGGEMFFQLHKEKDFKKKKQDLYNRINFSNRISSQNNMLYRDLKPENSMADISRLIKLTDFGLSKMFTKTKEKAFTICGTPQYLAPEILSNEVYENIVD